MQTIRGQKSNGKHPLGITGLRFRAQAFRQWTVEAKIELSDRSEVAFPTSQEVSLSRLKKVSVVAMALRLATRAMGLKSCSRNMSTFALPPLKYGYDALEPYIDATTMQVRSFPREILIGFGVRYVHVLTNSRFGELHHLSAAAPHSASSDIRLQLERYHRW